MQITRFFKDEPKEEIYKNLINYALRNCDTFMFFTCNYKKSDEYETHMERFIQGFLPYLIKVRHNGEHQTQWPGTISLDKRHEHNFMFFRTNPKLFDLLIQPGRLYNWRDDSYPEDLCFFRKGYCWLSTTAHENMAGITTEDRAEFIALESMGVVLSTEYTFQPFFEDYPG